MFFVCRGIDKPNVRFIIHHTISKSMENFYQESGRAGRDGSRAECILLYRFLDMAKITTMMFSEHTGLKNAYEMIEYAIDGISCRRDLIGKHFQEVWNNLNECKQMCDRCYHKDSVNVPKMLITEHCLDLYKIIDRAVSIDVKLTVLKLVDAWYQKGPTNLRVKEVEIPKFERYYAEQMVAYLIIKDFLKEDFHFSAYTTYSYVRKGGKLATADDRIVFYGARVLHLPEVTKELWGNLADDDCVFVSEDHIKRKKKSKKHKSQRKSRENSLCSSSLDGSFLSVSSIKSKRRRLSSDVASISSAQIDILQMPTPKSQKKKKNTKLTKQEDPDVGSSSTSNISREISSDKDEDCLLLSQANEIIEIDD